LVNVGDARVPAPGSWYEGRENVPQNIPDGDVMLEDSASDEDYAYKEDSD
jgi:hypothetical protein